MTAVRLRDDALTWRVVDGDVVVLDLKGGSYYKVNGSGAVLWELLAEPRTPEELVEALVARYDVDRPRALADVATFLDDMRAQQLLVE